MDIIIFIISLFLFLILFFLLGKIILLFTNFNSTQKYFRIFLELVIGLIFSVTSYSLIKTSGKTINFLFVFLALGAFFHARNKKAFFLNNTFSIKFILKDIFRVLIFSVPIFLTFLIFHFRINEGFMIPEPDYFIYSQWSEGLNISHNENLSHVDYLFNPELFSGVQTYHFFDLWVNAITNNISGNAVFSLLYVSYPLLTTILFLGIISIWEFFNAKINFLIIAVSFLLLFVQARHFPVYRGFLEEYTNLALILNTSSFSMWGKKLIPIYIFAILAFNLFLRKKNYLAILSLLALPVVNTGTLPSILMALFLYVVFYENKNRKKQVLLLAFIFTFALFYASFYFFLGIKNPDFASSHFLTIPNASFIITYFTKLLQLVVILFILYFPFFLFAFLTYKQKFKDVFFNIKPFFVITLFALPVGIAFHVYITDFNSIQLLTTLLVLANIIFIGILIRGFVNITKQFKINIKSVFILFLAFIFPLINMFLFYQYHDRYSSLSKSFSKKYLNEIENISNTEKQPLIAYYINEGGQRWYNRHLFTTPVAIPFRMQGKVNLVLLNTASQFVKMDEKYFNRKHYSFYHFIQQQKKIDKFISNEISRFEFIKENKINILVVQANSNFNIPKQIISKEITDNISGEKTYLLNDKY